MVKINDFRGDLTDISAKKEALTLVSKLNNESGNSERNVKWHDGTCFPYADPSVVR